MRTTSALLATAGLVSTIQGFTSLTASQADSVIRLARATTTSFLTKAVRLSFHDCVGGCDGCLNTDNEDNAGLAPLVAAYEEIYQVNGLDSVLSRADMWALMAIWAVNRTISLNNDDCASCAQSPDLSTEFLWGRVDCATAPYTTTDVGLPSALLHNTGLTSFFSSEFGFTAREATALMGVHTLGRADITNSGFHGTWVTDQQRFFNNQYFVNLADSGAGWRVRQRDCSALSDNATVCLERPTTGWQWNAANVGFNLNADMALYKEFTVATDGEPGCDYNSCAAAATAGDVEDFAGDNSLWLGEFSVVFQKMLAQGATGLQSLS